MRFTKQCNFQRRYVTELMHFQLTKIGGKLLVQKTLRMQFDDDQQLQQFGLGPPCEKWGSSALLESASSLSEEVKEVLYSSR